MVKIKNLFIFLIIIIGFTLCKNEEKPNYIILNGHIFGTTYKIVYTNSKTNYKKSIDSLFYLVNKSLSTYIPTSDISKINAGDSTVVVDDLFLEVFKKSKKIYTKTNGFFDPTVGNLVNAWGFGPKNEKKNLTANEIKQQMQFVGFHKVKIIDRKVIKEHPKIYLDFNAIAKGYAIDIVGRFLEAKKIANYLIEIGGEIRTRGKKANGNPWKIGLDTPNTDGSRTVSKTINLSNKSMATSGNYRKFRITKDGKKYVHTINPKTGFAKESNLLSVSVISNSDCADVDGYATAFMAMGLKKTIEFIQYHKNLDVLLLFTNANNKLEEFRTYSYH